MCEERIIELEERIAHMEHSLQTLSDALYIQQRQTEQLLDQLRKLGERIKPFILEAESSSPGHERPPHY